MDGSQVINTYLAGNFAPVRSEDDFELEVLGEIPAGLNGAFYRNGPNPQFEPRDTYHWFSGDGMIHGFYVEGGKVRYRNRYVRTPKWELEHSAGKSLFGTFGNPMTTDPAAMGQDSGVANTNIVWHANRLLALEEGHKPFELDPATLEPRGYADDYRGKVTAHPKLDPETGEMVWFAYSAGALPLNGSMSYGVTDAAGQVVRRDEFEAPFAAMVHDFLVTKRYALFPILPLTLSLQRAMGGQPPIAWEPDKGSHVGVMARDAGIETIRWFTTDACYVFHPMNAWEEGDKIFADVMEYPVAPLFPTVDGSRPQNAFARLVRWTFDLADDSNSIKRIQIDDLAGEFPRFDERRAGLDYRHGWFAGITRDASESIRFDTIAHIDLASGKRSEHVYDMGDSPGEPVFVPRTPDAAEGDGWLVAVVYRGGEDRSDFVVYDAQDVAKGPIATAKVPRRVPFGFHGNWRSA
ncbi:MAG TPA: carotenoid oxygenase family protein [Caulobacteraceae bacterium]|jgi:carotenoid cleavage dioxygenase